METLLGFPVTGWDYLTFLTVFIIGVAFLALVISPNSANATVVQRTIQLIPRLPEPTLVTDVLVEENMPVKKGQPLFQFDRRPYEHKVQQLEAQLAEAKPAFVRFWTTTDKSGFSPGTFVRF